MEAIQSVGSALGSIGSAARRVTARQTPLEKNLSEATSNENWGCSNTVLHEIARATYNYDEFPLIKTEIWAGVQDKPKYWKRILKSLSLLEFVIKNGSDRMLEEMRSGGQYKVRPLMDFNYSEEGKERGAGIREKAKMIIELISDHELLRSEREKAREYRQKFAGGNSALSSGDYEGGGGYGGYGGSGGGSGGSQSRGGGSGYDPHVTEKKFEEMRRRKEEERRGKGKDDRDYDRRRGDDDDRRKDDRDRRRRDDRDDDYDDRRRDKADDRRRRDDPDDDYDDRRYRDDRRSRNDRDDRDDRDRRRRNDDDDIDRRRRDDRDRRRPDDDDDRRKPSGRDRRRHEDDDEDDFRPDRGGHRSGKQAESASANLLDFDGPPQPAAKAGTASEDTNWGNFNVAPAPPAAADFGDFASAAPAPQTGLDTCFGQAQFQSAGGAAAPSPAVYQQQQGTQPPFPQQGGMMPPQQQVEFAGFQGAPPTQQDAAAKMTDLNLKDVSGANATPAPAAGVPGMPMDSMAKSMPAQGGMCQAGGGMGMQGGAMGMPGMMGQMGGAPMGMQGGAQMPMQGAGGMGMQGMGMQGMGMQGPGMMQGMAPMQGGCMGGPGMMGNPNMMQGCGGPPGGMMPPQGCGCMGGGAGMMPGQAGMMQGQAGMIQGQPGMMQGQGCMGGGMMQPSMMPNGGMMPNMQGGTMMNQAGGMGSMR